MKKNNFFLIAFSSIVGILFFLLNYFTPLLHDDLAYLYQFGPKAEVRPSNLPVQNLADVFRSQYYHYLDVNGRFTSHFLLQLLLLFGKNIFNIFNVLVFLGLIYFVNIYSKNRENTFFIYLFTIVSIWFLMPFFGQTILWTTGAINYLWTSCFVVLFIIVFRMQKHNPIKEPLKIVLLFFMSLFIAWMNESITFGVAVALFFYFLFNFKTLQRSEFFMLLGFGLGVLLIIFSPGTFNRVGNEAQIEFSLKRKILDIIAILFLLKWNLIISGVLLFFNILKRQNLIKIFRDNFIIIIAIIFNSILFLLIGNIEERMVFGNSVFILVFNVYLLKNLLKFIEIKWLKISSFFLLILFCFGYYQAFTIVKNYNGKHSFFENEIKNNKNGVVYFPNFENSRFVNNTLSGNSDFRNYHNRVRAFYYHVPEVNVLQETIYKNIFPINNVFTKEHQLKNWEKPVYYFHNTLFFEMPQDFNYQHRLDAELLIGNENKKVKVDFIRLNGKNYTAFINILETEFMLLKKIAIIDKKSKKNYSIIKKKLKVPKISIIIPVYNAEEYLEECLLSIGQQTFGDFEILAINDGSTDNSLEILNQYQGKEKRLKIFSQENKGVSAARNLGLENATGEYIGFVDADDWLHSQTLGTYIIALSEENSDIVISQFLLKKDNSIEQKCNVQIYDRQDVEVKIFPKFIESDVYNSVCNKLYKSDLIKKANAQFPVGVSIAEDAQFNHQVFSKALKVTEINFKSYFYREVNGSATKNVIRNDYLQSNIAIYQYDYQKYFGASVSELEILKLKKQRFFKSIIALIYIYFNPKNQFSLVQRFSKVKEILNNDLVKKIFSEDALKQNLGRYDLAIFKAIQIKNIFKLYLYTLYSYYRNK